MKYTSIGILIVLVGSVFCFAQSPKGSVTFDEAYFENHDKQTIENLREKMKEEFLRGSTLKEYDEIPKELKEQALQKYIKTYIRKNQMAKAAVEKKNKSLILFGQVLDQKDQPVPNAVVQMSVTVDRMVGERFLIQQSVKTECKVTTDNAGSFAITNAIGWMFTLENITAKGYTFVKNDQSSVYFHPTTRESQLIQQGYFLQDKKHRITLRLNKKD